MNNFIFKKVKSEDSKKIYICGINVHTTKYTPTSKKYYLFGIQYKNKKQKTNMMAMLNERLAKVEQFCINSTYNRTKTQPYIRQIAIMVAEHCNLNCYGCSHCSPLAEPEFLDINSYERDLERLALLAFQQGGLGIDIIQLQGGEPLLHPQFLDFIPVTRKYFPDSEITITTNGILLEQQPDIFWETLHKYNVEITPTIYPIKINWEDIKKKADEKGVTIDLTFIAENIFQEIKTSWHWPYDLKGHQEPVYNFTKCMVGNSCVGLSNGRLYTCVLPMAIKHFNKYFGTNIKVLDSDSIDIYKAQSFQEILDFLAKPMAFCRYCKIDERRFDLPWSRSKKDIKEWT